MPAVRRCRASSVTSVPSGRRTPGRPLPGLEETGRPDNFYARLTALAASGEAGQIDEVQSPDDNLQAVFKYMVKQ